MASREKTVARVAKLLALAGSPSAAEAAAARGLAERLMAAHGISRKEAESASGAPGGYREVSLGRRSWSEWREALAVLAARRAGVEVVVNHFGRRREVRLAGDGARVGEAAALYESLLGFVLTLGRGVDVGDGELADVLRDEVDDYGRRECLGAFRRGAVRGVAEVMAREARTAGAVARSRGSESRVREKYVLAGERSVGLDEVFADAWFELGRREARRRFKKEDAGR